MPAFLSWLLVEPAPAPWIQNRSWHRWLVVGLICIGTFVGQLDATIVQLALPTLGRAFNVPLQEVSWVALSYLLAFASFLPIFGRLCEMFGRKTLYIAGYAIFISASALCGFAETFDQLLFFRFLQGIGGSLLGANSISILVKSVPAESRGRALGYFAAAQAIGMCAGPAIGGVLLATLGWRWIFWITVPFGVFAVVLGWLSLPRSIGVEGAKSFDWGGALLIGPALILTVTALNHASGSGMGSKISLVSIAVAAVLYWLLVRRERSSSSPLINPGLFRIPAFYLGATAVALSYALLYGIFFLMSFALEHGYAESPAEAGFRLAIVPVALGLTAPFSSQLAERLGIRSLSALAMLLCLAAAILLMLTTADIAHHRLYHTIAFILFGVGLGLFIAPNNTFTLAVVPSGLSGAAGSMLNLTRSLGTSLGVAVGAATLAWRLRTDTGAGTSWLTASSEDLLAAVSSSLPALAVLAIFAGAAQLIASRQSGDHDPA
ncbi:MAG: MFS transporter [Hyphomicrobiales bacterium]|nr:MFS transporter [Hyphomicrobiales bacterium]